MGRVWIYIISKALSSKELLELNTLGEAFVKGWTAHEQKLNGSFEIFKNRIIIVKVNEDVHGASGCSIDKLTRFIKEIENKFSVELMNRLLVAIKVSDEVEICHSSKIKELLLSNSINENTTIYNTAINTSLELIDWEQPLKNTWLSKFLVNK